MTNHAQLIRGLKHFTRQEPSVKSGLPEFWFGAPAQVESGSSVTPYRIGLWSCLSSTHPEVMQGVWAILANLLELDRNTAVYRILAQVEEPIESYRWEVSKSQFGVDDWYLEDLDENIAIWGKLDLESGSYTLQVWVESDFDERDDPLLHTVHAANLAELLGELPQLAKEILGTITASSTYVTMPSFEQISLSNDDTEKLHALLKQVFQWELQLYLNLWGKSWEDEAILSDYSLLQAHTRELASPVATWALGTSTKRVLNPGFAVIGELIYQESLDETYEILQAYPQALSAVARAAFQFGDRGQVVRKLAPIATNSTDPRTWALLGSLAIGDRQIQLGVDTFQQAIENDFVDAPFYRGYAESLSLLRSQEARIPSYILIDPDEIGSDRVLWEAIEAYEEAIALDAEYMPAYYRQLLLMIQANAPDVPQRIEAALTNGMPVGWVPGIVEQLDVHEYEGEFDSLISTIRSSVDDTNASIVLKIAYAKLLNLNYQYPEAVELLTQALGETNKINERSQIERLLLSLSDETFEYRFGEVSSQVYSGASITDADLEFLEDVIERAPSMFDGYHLLGQAYITGEYYQDALDLMLEAHEQFRGHPDVYDLLSYTFWRTKQPDLAEPYVVRGLEIDPSHVGLSVTSALLKFDDGEINVSRDLLKRAENLNPYHMRLNEARRYIADRI